MRHDEWSGQSDFETPFEVIEPAALSSPLIFNSPHSGSVYPARFLALSRLDALALRKSEDAFVDDLMLRCVGVGAPLLRAHFPRAFLDVNREPFELDPQMFDSRLPDFANTRSLRVAGGLGTVPRLVGEGLPIYKGPLPVAEALGRIATLYKPYHETLRALIERSHAAFGLAVTIDCHSMPSSLADGPAPDFVLGDRFGASAGAWVVDTLEDAIRDAGYRVRRNKPYAGGFITEHYGSPAMSRHVVQLEMNRALYMDERRMTKLSSWGSVCDDLYAAAAALAIRAIDEIPGRQLAAE